MFVARATQHPAEDLARNWSAPVGGFSNEDMQCVSFETLEAANEAFAEYNCDGFFKAPTFRFHPAYESYVEVHYEGLGAWCLDSESLEDAIVEASKKDAADMICTDAAGDGHFYAADVVSFHDAGNGIWVFELK